MRKVGKFRAWQTDWVATLLIRHAQAGARKEWPGDDRLRPLSVKGSEQARSLVGRILGYEPTRILSSPYRRCIETVVPLAEKLGLEVESRPELAEGNGPAALALVRSVLGANVAICTHGDVIPEVLVALVDEDRLDLGVAPRQSKGSVWVLESEGARFTSATYLPPTPE